MKKIIELIKKNQLNLIDDLIEIFKNNNVETLSKSEIVNLLAKQRLENKNNKKI